MHDRFLSMTVASYLLCGLGAVALEGCGCFDGEESAREACREITGAVNQARESCGMLASDEAGVCGEVCAGPAGCQEPSDVRACSYAIEALACDEITPARYRSLPECYEIFNDMTYSCADSGNDDGADFDDDD